MAQAYWQRVQENGLAVPTDRPLVDLTTELTRMLGSTDPDLRDGVAFPVLATWITEGVYDDLLAGLGDGMAAGLTQGLGESGTDTVFRRSFSVLILAVCVERDNAVRLLPDTKLLEWGDRVGAWLVREQDVRGFVPGKGWAHAVAHGADALGALAESPHFRLNELVVLLDVIADRVLAPTPTVLTCGEPDRLARAATQILRRGIVPLPVIGPLVNRIVAAITAEDPADRDPFLGTGNPDAFLRALYLQAALTSGPDDDLVKLLGDALVTTKPYYFGATAQ
ncbi:MAG: DUF2785 domain-containing protein [Nocardioides sp.]